MSQAETFAKNPIQAQIDRYHAAKPQGDIDLVAEVRQILIESGQAGQLEHFDNHPRIQQAKDKHSDVQRFCLNQFWTIQLGDCEKPSFNERSYLIPHGEKTEWLKLFRQGVLPFIIDQDLPKQINNG